MGYRYSKGRGHFIKGFQRLLERDGTGIKFWGWDNS